MPEPYEPEAPGMSVPEKAMANIDRGRSFALWPNFPTSSGWRSSLWT